MELPLSFPKKFKIHSIAIDRTSFKFFALLRFLTSTLRIKNTIGIAMNEAIPKTKKLAT
jgi:hypothetical protein